MKAIFINPIKNFVIKLSLLQRNYRRLLLLFIDLIIVIISIKISLILNKTFLEYKDFEVIKFCLVGVFSSSLIYIFSGQYAGFIKYVGTKSIYNIGGRNFFVILLQISILKTLEIEIFDIRYWFILFLILSFFMGLSKILFRDILIFCYKLDINKPSSVVIYGAGASGAQLEALLKLNEKYKVLFFIDDSPELWNRTLNGKKIKPFESITVVKRNIDFVFLAKNELNSEKKFEIFKTLNKLKIKLLIIPSIEEIATDKSSLKNLRPLKLKDLLGRNPVLPIDKIFGPTIKNLNILVSGGGGSIGSELCRTLLKLKPKKLILLEQNEYNLYKIEKELNGKNNLGIEIIPILGDACNRSQVFKIFEENKINIVFHAAAYKHVPIAEKNIIVSIWNNVFSTQLICDAANKYKANKVILISTDKAVRPANVMGASKRLAEMIIQANAKYLNNKDSQKTIFSIVRFGNVLDSSGSVIPLFKEQIARGGPITITHREIIRYFMTITEAAELLIQATAISKSGEVVLLEMGSPVKIKDLATQMVCLSGLTIKDETNPNGDIEITYTGLRPGEKLYEELLIDANSLKTIHPRIFKAKEKFSENINLFEELKIMKEYIKNNNENKVLKKLKDLVPEWDNSRYLDL